MAFVFEGTQSRLVRYIVVCYVTGDQTMVGKNLVEIRSIPHFALILVLCSKLGTHAVVWLSDQFCLSWENQ